MLTVGLGAFMSSTGVVAIFIPGGVERLHAHANLTVAPDDAPELCWPISGMMTPRLRRQTSWSIASDT